MRHFCGKRDSVFGGQPRHAAEAVVGVVGGDGTLRRLGQPVVLVIGIGAACCPDVLTATSVIGLGEDLRYFPFS